MGYASRRETAAACRAGIITLGGEVVTKAAQAISLDRVRAGALCFDGEVVGPLAPLTLMLHKPEGYSCSHKGAGALVYDLLPYRFRARKPALSSVGRLDKESTGLLLITDDGEFLHRVIHRKTHSPKHYRVSVRDRLRGNESELFSTGEFMLMGDHKPLKPAIWSAESLVSGVMILTEGRYHQIRRMFEVLGNHVTALHRFQTGNLALGDLPTGEYKILSPADLLCIFS
jgi:16S rRNA pseudouridine516 synthase